MDIFGWMAAASDRSVDTLFVVDDGIRREIKRAEMYISARRDTPRVRGVLHLFLGTILLRHHRFKTWAWISSGCVKKVAITHPITGEARGGRQENCLGHPDAAGPDVLFVKRVRES